MAPIKSRKLAIMGFRSVGKKLCAPELYLVEFNVRDDKAKKLISISAGVLMLLLNSNIALRVSVKQNIRICANGL